jgi:hypothetical protein
MLLIVIQAFIGVFIAPHSCFTRYTAYSMGIVIPLALLMMLINGAFMSTRYFAIVKVGFGVLVLGVLFKILHLTGADQILAIGFLITAFAYGLHFVMKRPKTLLDYSKFLTMMCFVIPALLDMVGVISEQIKEVFEFAGQALLLLTFVLFLILERKKIWAKNVSTP